jgi:hypothetical protein
MSFRRRVWIEHDLLWVELRLFCRNDRLTARLSMKEAGEPRKQVVRELFRECVHRLRRHKSVSPPSNLAIR